MDGIFDAEIATATNLKRKDTEDDQVKALVARKEELSASAIFTSIGTMCVTSSAILKAQMIQLDSEARKKEATLNKKKTIKSERLQVACETNGRRMKEEV